MKALMMVTLGLRYIDHRSNNMRGVDSGDVSWRITGPRLHPRGKGPSIPYDASSDLGSIVDLPSACVMIDARVYQIHKGAA